MVRNVDVIPLLRIANSSLSIVVNTVVASCATITIMTHEGESESLVNYKSATARFAVLLSLSFFISDSVLWILPLLRYYLFDHYSVVNLPKPITEKPQLQLLPIQVFLTREWDDKSLAQRYVFLVHHFVCIISFYWILSTNQLLYFACHRLLAEYSTPFLNLIFISDQLPSLPPLYHHLSVIIFSIVFLICRPCATPFFWRHVYQTNWIDGVDQRVRICQLLCPFVLDVLNIYWSVLIYRRLMRTVQSMKHGDKQS